MGQGPSLENNGPRYENSTSYLIVMNYLSDVKRTNEIKKNL